MITASFATARHTAYQLFEPARRRSWGNRRKKPRVLLRIDAGLPGTATPLVLGSIRVDQECQPSRPAKKRRPTPSVQSRHAH